MHSDKYSAQNAQPPSEMSNRLEAQVLDKVTFTHMQLAWLDKVFPEVTTGNCTDAQLRFNSGQRSVLAILKTRVK